MFTNEQLKNATSAETAVIVEDYPYGFKLRCRMRYWIEYKKGHGFRMVSQSSNPKRGNVWNKPKAGTYNRVAMALIQNEEGHVGALALSEYSDLAEYAQFKERAADTMCDAAVRSYYYYSEVKLAHERKKVELGVVNIYEANAEQREVIQKAVRERMIELYKAGYVDM